MSSSSAGKKVENYSETAAERGYQLLSAILILAWRCRRRWVSQEQAHGCHGAVHRPGVGKKSFGGQKELVGGMLFCKTQRGI